MIEKWRFLEPDEASAQLLSAELNLSLELSRLLINRGITTVNAARSFLYDGLESLSSPWLLSGVHEAVERVADAVKRREKIVIYGDYDVDGICSIVLMVECFARLGARADYYVPNRFGEGYGLNAEAVRKLAAAGYSLMITVDCGINSVKELELAQQLGLDVVVSDHHQVMVNEWPAAAVIAPRRDGIPEVQELSGTGVAFKLAQALLEHHGRDLPWDQFLELLALATVADVVPLHYENRIMAREGLKRLKDTRRPGLQALLRECGLQDKRLRSTDIAFQLAPHLNSAGRMQQAGLSVRLLLERDDTITTDLARQLCKLNEERREVQADIFKQAKELWEQQAGDDWAVIVLGSEEWHEGVSGIVASQLCQYYNKPAVVIVWDGHIGKGSARSVSGINLLNALEQCGQWLSGYGGHAMAAGLTLRREQFEDFRRALHEQVSLCGAREQQSLREIDFELAEERLMPELAQEIELLEPFGMGNPEPLVLARGVRLIQGRWLGKEQQHLKAVTAVNGVEVIAFRYRDQATQWEDGAYYDILAHLEARSWRQHTSLQLRAAELIAAPQP
ncbi:MAG: single-stranded-DNA-specific exonuclease RecJ [Syntrophomonadaceae bacterium]|nr:single-stranded-DNA-specific exonuclease RecJ [Syntrophomonadaceae bacterium]